MSHQTCFRFTRKLPILIVALGLFAAFASSQGVQRSVEEGKLFDLLNQARKENKLPSLRWNAQLAAAARRHAEMMAEHNALSHGFSGELGLTERVAEAAVRFSTVAENVGLGPTPEVIHDLLMKSPGHRANILDTGSNEVGVAVVRRNSDLFAVQDFAHIVPDLDSRQQVAIVGDLLRKEGYAVVSREQIAAFCESEDGPALPGETQILRYETADLSILPDSLRSKDMKQHFRTVSVASCSMDSRQQPAKGPTPYRMVVVLN